MGVGMRGSRECWWRRSCLPREGHVTSQCGTLVSRWLLCLVCACVAVPGPPAARYHGAVPAPSLPWRVTFARNCWSASTAAPRARRSFPSCATQARHVVDEPSPGQIVCATTCQRHDCVAAHVAPGGEGASFARRTPLHARLRAPAVQPQIGALTARICARDWAGYARALGHEK